MIKSLLSERQPFNIWYVSDDGSDDNDCHSASAPCRNLQTVLDRATDGADIYVTSDTLSLDGQTNGISCYISSPLSYTISHLNNKMFTFTCPGLCAFALSNTVFRSLFVALSIYYNLLSFTTLSK